MKSHARQCNIGDMKTYLVGGAVRDRLLGLPVVDRDWVVVGETPETMLAAGFTPVGKDFPVFLHPESHEEYALARTERKTAPGYRGFQFNTDISVTLEQDLLRRDLTINAIAQDHEGNLVDPFNGQQDIATRVFRHVSAAFTEDPVRVLRIAKFMARFSHLGFTVADTTVQLMRSMVDSGEIDNLVPERVWREVETALAATSPSAFFTCLLSADALAPVMPELAQALQRPFTGNEDASPVTGSEPMLDCLQAACDLSDSACVRFAALCSGFNATHTASLKNLCERLRIPAKFSELALLSARHTATTHKALEFNSSQLHTLLRALDTARRPDRFNDFLTAAQANSQAQTSSSDGYPQAERLRVCAQAMNSIDAAQVAKAQADKATIPTAIRQREVSAIETCLSRL